MSVFATLPGVLAPWELEEEFSAAAWLPSAPDVESGKWHGADADLRTNRRTDLVSDPEAASDGVQYWDRQRCIEVDPDAIVTGGVAFEMLRFPTPSASVVVVEDLATIFEAVEALDENGDSIYAFGGINGESMCRSVLEHPTPNVGALTWRWALTWDDRASLGHGVQPYRVAVDPSEVHGTPLTPQWSDLRYGPNSVYAGKNRQFQASSSVIVRLWLVLYGPQERFRVRVGARLAGFVQAGGMAGSALDSVTQRRV